MTLYITSLLGTPPGTSTQLEGELWWISDFCFARELLGEQTAEYNQNWLTQIEIYDELEKLKDSRPTSNHTLLHGPPQSQRFELTRRDRFYETLANTSLRRFFLLSVAKQARCATANDQIVILLFGHGDPDHATFGRVQCGEHKGSTIWLERAQVEAALGTTKARISIISTACFAGTWQSERWALFSAAQMQFSIGLPASESNQMWGSPFWAAMAELSANAHGATFHPDLIHPQSQYFNPPLDATMLHPLMVSARLSADPSHDLGVSDVADAFAAASAALWDNTTPEAVKPHDADAANGLDFTPTVPTNAQWDGWHSVLGIEESIDIILRSNRLPRHPPNPRTSPLDDNERILPVTGAMPSRVNYFTEEASDDSDSSDESCRDDSESDDSEVDRDALDVWVTHWETKTRPLNKSLGDRHALFLCVANFRTDPSPRETRALYLLFKQRDAADQLAQQLADEIGISLPIRCKDYREVDHIHDHLEIPFMFICWGRLAPRDLIGKDKQPYQKAGQWLFRCWVKSGKGVEELSSILGKVGGWRLELGVGLTLSIKLVDV
ncbi:hypothetical protein GGX14DRAFT_571382 [Mycena pura]|uniref:Uncharacterized protein n=1 Tax=Mycena pura TaxID=153505 RepID=A0AAD6VA27_9AGAR|nr:hypothetical protein GGX14DRAFT_571382 [Mycena pura]